MFPAPCYHTALRWLAAAAIAFAIALAAMPQTALYAL